MEWPENLASALPAPRSDEPPDLRRRIIAELRDHLHTAWQRELLRTGDAEEARKNVLARFGDPARLARKLWFNAMWEKIMMQRAMLMAVAAMIVVCAASVGLTWFLVVQAGQVNQAVLEQNRAVNEALLARLQALGAAPGDTAARSAEWSPLKFRVTLDQSGGAPAAGVKIGIQGQAYAAGSATQLERTTGPDGIADFGLVRPGQYLVNAETSSGEALSDTTAMGMGIIEFSGLLITVSPGQSQTQELICPSPPQEAAISLEFDWPPEVSGRPLWLVCEFARQPQNVGGHQWSRTQPQPQFIVIDSAGHLMNPDMHRFGDGAQSSEAFFPQTESFYQEEESRHFVDKSKSFVDVPGIYRFASSRGAYVNERDIPVHIWLPESSPVSQLKWPAGTYIVARLVVGRDGESPDVSLPNDVRHPEFLGAIEFADSEQSRDKVVYPDSATARASRRQRREVKSHLPPLEAVAGRANEWRLTIPPRLVDLLAERPPAVRESNDAPAAVEPPGPAASYRPAAPVAAPTRSR